MTLETPARIALVTCADIPDLEDDDRLVFGPLADHGYAVEPVTWDDPNVNWSRFGLAVLRSPWDYAPRHDEFVAWSARTPRLANDAATVAWNTDKFYLAGLADAGIEVVPTQWVAPDDTDVPLPADGVWVVKPSVSAGSRDTGRYVMSDPTDRDLAAAHLGRLRGAGRWAMLQPYLAAVDSYGETALIFFDGVYSHAIRKGPMLNGPDFGMGRDPGLYKPEAITSREPSEVERALADRVLAALPAEVRRPLYARVDVIPGADGVPTLIELELTEPSLFLAFSDGAPARFAAAIAARASDHFGGTDDGCFRHGVARGR